METTNPYDLPDRIREAYGLVKFDQATLQSFRQEILPLLDMASPQMVEEFDRLYMDHQKEFQVLVEQVMFGISLILTLSVKTDFLTILSMLGKDIPKIHARHIVLRDTLLYWCGIHEMCPVREDLRWAGVSASEITKRVAEWKTYMNENAVDR